MVYFLSDLHLGAKYIADTREAERRVVAFLRSIRDDATDIYLMGDILDYWFEYRTVVPRGYIRFLGELADMADSGIRIHWFIGNHDIWLFDYLSNEIGMEVTDGYQVETILGKKFFLSHGDGIGKLKLGFRFIRWMFRNKFFQKLYSGIHPRWTLPLAHAWSAKSRDFESYESPKYKGLNEEPQALFAREYLKNVDPSINYFIFGHLHVLVKEDLSPTCQLIILGDWITQFTYAKFDGENISLKHFTT